MIKKFLIKCLIFVFISGWVIFGQVSTLSVDNLLITTHQGSVEGERSPEIPPATTVAASLQTSEKSSPTETESVSIQVDQKLPDPEKLESFDQSPSSAQPLEESGSEVPGSAQPPIQLAQAQRSEGEEKPPEEAPAQAQPPAQQAPDQKPESAEKPPQPAPAQPPAQQAPQGPPQGPPPMPVEVAEAISRPIRSNTALTGTVLPITSVALSTLIAGQIEEIKVDEGDIVAQGDVIARLRDIEARIDVQEAAAALDKARRELQKSKSGFREQEIKTKQAEVAEKKAVMEKLKRELERAEALFTDGIINQSQRDSAEADYKTALSQYESAMANLDLTMEGTRSEDIAAAQAEVAMREAILARKQQLLKDTQIRAPISGAITKKHVEIGEWINSGGAIVDIVDYSVVKISIDVPEREIQMVQKGIKAEISVDAYPGEIFTGAVTQVIPAANVNNRTFPVLIEMDNSEHKLKPGMFARVNLIISEDTNTVLVPKDALLADAEGKNYVFIVRDSAASRVDIQTGLTDGNYIEVKGDVKIGDLVVVTGNETLRDKAPIRIMKQL